MEVSFHNKKKSKTKKLIQSLPVNINVKEWSQTKKPPINDELPPNFLLWTSVKCVGISLGVAFVCGVSFHLLWNRRRGTELKHGDHKSGKCS